MNQGALNGKLALYRRSGRVKGRWWVRLRARHCWITSLEIEEFENVLYKLSKLFGDASITFEKSGSDGDQVVRPAGIA